MEKKLTEEEVVKALWVCTGIAGTNCTECPYYKKKIMCYTGKRKEKDAIDLIHRLQAENAEYERKLADGELCSMEYHQEQMGVLNCEIEEYKAEIERLTEENGYLDGCAKQFLAYHQKCEIERAELENQVDELVKEKSMISQRIVKDTAKEIIAFVEEKDKKAGKYSIYRTLLQELKERYEVE